MRAVGAVLKHYMPSLSEDNDKESEGAVQVVRLSDHAPDTACDHLSSLTANYSWLHHSSRFLSSRAKIDKEEAQFVTLGLAGGQATGAMDAEGAKKREGEAKTEALSVLLPGLRFLHYTQNGSCSPPHTDLAKTSPCYVYGRGQEEEEEGARVAQTVTSTHTFILYLSDCHQGGETAHPAIPSPKPHQSRDNEEGEGEGEGEEEEEKQGGRGEGKGKRKGSKVTSKRESGRAQREVHQGFGAALVWPVLTHPSPHCQYEVDRPTSW